MEIAVASPADLGPAELARWREFQAKDPSQDNPFLSPEFTIITGELRPAVRVAVITDGGEIVGFFPHERHRLGTGRPVAAGLSDLQGMVHAEGLSLDARRLLRACGLSSWEFDHLRDGEPVFSRHRAAVFPSPMIDLADGFDAYTTALRARSAKTYKMINYQRRRLGREAGEVRHEMDSAEVADLHVLLGWKSAQYRRTGRSDRFAHPWIVRLVERLHETRSTTFAGILSTLYAGDRLIAAHFGLRTPTVLATWFPAYDTDFAKYSPGLVQHLEMTSEAADLGIRYLDMGRGEKDYKEKLKTGEFSVAEGRVSRPSAGAAVAWASTEPVRQLRNYVLANPRLRDRADRLLKWYGSRR